jgi:hypothetical protein
VDGPRYLVFDDTPKIRVLNCTADDWATALRVPLAAIGVRVIRRRGSTTKPPLSEFRAHGLSRKQYAAMATQVAQIVDELTSAFHGAAHDKALSGK